MEEKKEIESNSDEFLEETKNLDNEIVGNQNIEENKEELEELEENFIEETKNIEDLDDIKENKLENNNDNSKKLLSIVYFVIMISIGIAVAFYIKQAKAPENEKVENTQSNEVIETNSGVVNNINNTSSGNSITTNSGKIENKSDLNNIVSSTGEIKKINIEEKKKNEEAIVKDFEKELDSLFDIIDKNGK